MGSYLSIKFIISGWRRPHVEDSTITHDCTTSETITGNGCGVFTFELQLATQKSMSATASQIDAIYEVNKYIVKKQGNAKALSAIHQILND